MKNPSNEEGVPINVRFEYLNKDEELVLSDRYTVKLIVDNNKFEDIEEARITIINKCNFRTFEERFNYYMFDKNKLSFLKKDDDISCYIALPPNPKNKKNKKEKKVEPKDLIMINCNYFAEHICDILQKETSTYTDSEESKGASINSTQNMEIKRTINYLKDYFKNEYFAEFFIRYNGITYLDKIIRHNRGNMRAYGLQSISKLFDYEKAYEYFYKKLELLSNLYEIAVTEDRENIKATSHSLDLIIKIIGNSEERTMYVIDVGEKYAKKTHTKLFQAIVNNLKEKNLETDIKLKSILFINTVINFCHPSIVSRIIIQLQETGILELAEKIMKQKQEKHQDTSHENDLEDQISIFIDRYNQITSEPELKVEMIKKYIEDMKNHIKEIELKNNSFKEQSEFYDYIIKDFVEYIDISDCVSIQSSIGKSNNNSKDNKEKFEPSMNKKVTLDESGNIDVKALVLQENQEELNDLARKYAILKEEYHNLIETNKKLGGKYEEVTNNEISELEKHIKTEKEDSSKFEEFKKELEVKIKELSESISKSEQEIKEESFQETLDQISNQAPPQDTTQIPLGNTKVPESSVPSPPSTIPPPPGKIPPPPSLIPSPPGTVPPPPGVPLPPGVPPPPGVPLPPGVPPPPGVPMPPGVPPPPGVPMPPGAPFLMNPNVPVATKPKIILKTKTKQLQWQKILLLPKTAENRPDLIWNIIFENEVKLDIDEVVSHFGIRKKEQKEKKSVVEVKKFLDSKRTQEVSVIRTKLPEPDVVANALIVFNQSLLNEEQVDGLLKILITKEELETYKKMGEDGNWDKGEKYIVKINDIPNHKTKLNIWSLISNFEAKLPGMIESLKYMKGACEEIKSNQHFKLILSVILGLGNILNGGTNRGQADGFNLDLLKKLPGTKDNNGNSILNWICAKANRIDPSFEGFKGKFPQLEKAAQFSNKETNQNLVELKKMENQIERFLKDLPNDKFKEKAEENLNNFKEKTKKFNENYDENLKVYKNLIKFFGYKETDDIAEKNEVFFKMLLDFFKEIDKNMPKLDVKKIFDVKNKRMSKKVNQMALMNNLMSKLKQKVHDETKKNKNEIVKN